MKPRPAGEGHTVLRTPTTLGAFLRFLEWWWRLGVSVEGVCWMLSQLSQLSQASPPEILGFARDSTPRAFQNCPQQGRPPPNRKRRSTSPEQSHCVASPCGLLGDTSRRSIGARDVDHVRSKPHTNDERASTCAMAWSSPDPCFKDDLAALHDMIAGAGIINSSDPTVPTLFRNKWPLTWLLGGSPRQSSIGARSIELGGPVIQRDDIAPPTWLLTHCIAKLYLYSISDIAGLVPSWIYYIQAVKLRDSHGMLSTQTMIYRCTTYRHTRVQYNILAPSASIPIISREQENRLKRR